MCGRRCVEAVRKRLVSDVPLGALLSGGIDSSIVVAAMAQHSTEPVRTFSVGFPDARYDERAYARQVAERYGTRHEELLVEPDAAELLPRLAAAYDEPFGDSSALPTYLVCELARRHVTVALTGDGGDEAFGGYERYRALGYASTLGRLPRALPRAGARLLRALPAGRREPRSPLFRAARFLEAAATPAAERYGRLMEVFPAPLRRTLWSDDALAEIGAPRSAASLLGPLPAPGITGLQLLDAGTYLPGDLLFKADIASMAVSLELRSPLLDHEVVELALGAARLAEGAGRARQARAAARVCRRSAARRARTRQEGLRRPGHAVVPGGAERPRRGHAARRAGAGTRALPAGGDRVPARRPCRRASRPRPPPLEPAHARAVARAARRGRTAGAGHRAA